MNAESAPQAAGPRLVKLLRGSMVLGVGLTLATRVTVILTGMLSAIVTARTLGTAGRGEYVYISTLGLLAVQLANFGLSADNARNAALDPTQTGRLAGNSLWAAIGLGLVATAGMAIYHWINGNGAPLASLAVLIVFVPSTLYGLVASNILIGLGRMKAFNIYLLASNLFQLGAILLAGLVSRRPETLLWASAAAVFASTLGLFWLFRPQGRDIIRFDAALMRGGLRFAGRIYVITLLGFAITRVNVLMLGAMSSKTELGVYSVAMQFGDALMLLPGTIAMMLFPELVKAQRNGGILGPTLRAAGWTIAFLLPSVVALWLLAPFIMHTLFGPEFIPAAQVLRIMLPGVFALGVASIFSQALAADGVPPQQIAVWVVAGAVIVGSNMIFIPAYGAVGAAMSFACSYTLAAIGLVGLVLWRARLARVKTTD